MTPSVFTRDWHRSWKKLAAQIPRRTYRFTMKPQSAYADRIITVKLTQTEGGYLVECESGNTNGLCGILSNQMQRHCLGIFPKDILQHMQAEPFTGPELLSVKGAFLHIGGGVVATFTCRYGLLPLTPQQQPPQAITARPDIYRALMHFYNIGTHAQPQAGLTHPATRRELAP